MGFISGLIIGLIAGAVCSPLLIKLFTVLSTKANKGIDELSK